MKKELNHIERVSNGIIENGSSKISEMKCEYDSDDSCDYFFQSMNKDLTNVGRDTVRTYSFDSPIRKREYASISNDVELTLMELDFNGNGNGSEEVLKEESIVEINNFGDDCIIHRKEMRILPKLSGVIDLNPSDNPLLSTYEDSIFRIIGNKTFPFMIEKLKEKIILFTKSCNLEKDEIGDLLFRFGITLISICFENKSVIEVFEAALEIYSKINNNNNNEKLKLNNSNLIRLAETQKKLSDCFVIELDLISADYYIDSSLLNFKSSVGSQSERVAECFFKKGFIKQLEEKWKESEKYFICSLNTYKKYFKYNRDNKDDKYIINVEIGNVYFKLGLIYEKNKNYKNSKDSFVVALEIYKNVYLGEINNELCAMTFYQLGIISEANDEIEKALDYYIITKNILRNLTPKDQNYIDILIKIGYIYNDNIKDIDEVVIYLEEAIELIMENNNCENLNILLQLMIKELNQDIINSIIEISFILSKVYIDNSYTNFKKGLQHFKFILYFVNASKDFFDETFELIKKYLDKIDNKKEHHKHDEHISECLKYFSNKLELEKDRQDSKGSLKSGRSTQSQNEMRYNNYFNQIISNYCNTSNQYKQNRNMTELFTNPDNNLKEVVENSEYFFSTMKIGEIFYFLSRFCNKLGMGKDTIELMEKSVLFYEKSDQNFKMKIRICEILNDIGIEYNQLGNFEESLNCFKRVLKMRLTLNQSDVLKIAGAYNNIAIAYDKLKNYEEAIFNWKKCMEIRIKFLNEDDIVIADSYYNYALILSKIKSYEDALNNMLKSILIYNNKIGMNSNQSVDAASCVGEYYKNLKRPEESIIHLERAYTYYRKKFSEKDNRTLKSRILYGICMSRIGNYDKALELFEPVIDSIKPLQFTKETSEIVIEMWIELGICYEMKKDYYKALNTFESLVKINREILGEEKSLEIVKRIYHNVKLKIYLFN